MYYIRLRTGDTNTVSDSTSCWYDMTAAPLDGGVILEGIFILCIQPVHVHIGM